MRTTRLTKIAMVIFLSMIFFLGVQKPVLAAGKNTTVKIPVEQIFEVNFRRELEGAPCLSEGIIGTGNEMHGALRLNLSVKRHIVVTRFVRYNGAQFLIEWGLIVQTCGGAQQ